MLYNMGARIRATGSYLPEQIVTDGELLNSDGRARGLHRLLGTQERRAARADESCADLIAEAGRRVLAEAELSPLDIDRIVVSAAPGDYFEPPTASIVQYKLQARCPAIELKMSCVGWLAGVDYALRCLATGDRRVLVLAGTIVSRGDGFLLVQHRAIFGDGAAGVLLEADQQRSFLAGNLWTEGENWTMITLPHPWSPPVPGVPAQFQGKFHMGPREVFVQRISKDLLPSVEGVLREAGLTRDDIDVAIIHQPNKPLFDAAAQALELPPEKAIDGFYRYGNTIAAELPIALDESVRNGRIRRGDTVLLVTFGAGFNLGVMVLEY